MTESELAPCPFCGNDKPSFERLGSPRQSCIVICGNCGCRHESSDEGDRSGSQWNDRASSPPVAQQGAEVMATIYKGPSTPWGVATIFSSWRGIDSLPPGEHKLYASPQPQPAVQMTDAEKEAYSMVDRFLRNNLDDTDYGDYSNALEILLAASTTTPKAQP